MAAGKHLRKPTRRQHRRIEAAVQQAEDATGLDMCVYLGPAEEDARAHAESFFVERGLHERPAVLLLVAPPQRRVEIVTAPSVRDRLPDAVCEEAVSAMVARFRDGDLTGGLEEGLRRLAAAAGAGRGRPITGADDERGDGPDVIDG